MSITAGIDCGTQSTKVICYDSITKQILAKTSSTHKLISKDDGSREQEAIWYEKAIIDCFNQIPADIKNKIEGIGVSGQQHGFVALDSDGNSITSVKLWCDTSTTKQCEYLTKKLGGEDKVFSLIGNQILPGYTASKVLALKQNKPEIYKKLAHILLPHDYINYFLTGNYVMEKGDASGTAFFDVVNQCWSTEVLKAIDETQDLEAMLPKLINADEKAGTVSSKSAKLLGIKENVIVSCGGGDNMMGAIGCGCTQEGNLVMSMGTSGTLFGYSNSCVTDNKGRLAAFMSSSGGYLPLLCTMNFTVVSEQIRNALGLSVRDFDNLASLSVAGSNGLVILPYFNGERTPNYPNGEAAMVGMNINNTSKENIARASLESVVFGMKVGLEAFIEQGFSATKLLIIGGGANSKIWAQIVSDIFELPVEIPSIKESAAFGGALQVLSLIENKLISEITSIHHKVDESNKYYPNQDNHDLYEKAYAKYKKYDNQLAPLFK
jgi:xylulokinase